MISRFTIAGVFIALVSGLGAVFSATRYLSGQRTIDRLVGLQGLTYTIPLLIFALLLLLVGFFVPRFVAKYGNRT